MTSDLESSFALLGRARAGDHDAWNQLIERYWPRLRAWAIGRLPPTTTAHSAPETFDLVHNAILRAFTKVCSGEIHTEGALLDYLRTSVNYAIIDERRVQQRRPYSLAVPKNAPAEYMSPLDAAIGTESLEKYERALATLLDQDRQAVILRIEFGLTYEEIAIQLEQPTTAATRLTVTRAIARLAAAMGSAA